jgi:membrane protease YdiL (CAAX protease family)
MMRILRGPDGKPLPMWRGILFYVAATWVVFPLLEPAARWVGGVLHLTAGLTAANIIWGELQTLLVALICTGAFALYERRRVTSYGFPLGGAISWAPVQGVVLGLALAAAVAACMLLLGGMRVRGLAQGGLPLAGSALAWLAANLCVGIAEEAFYRGYFLQALWRTIGFWPASLAVALVFAADHYFRKPGENLFDVITLVSFSMFVSYTVLKTGSLWFAVGFHAAFDYMQLFVIGSPNGDLIPAGRLLDVVFLGPPWLTGGVLGTEASLFMYPALALTWLGVWWRYRSTVNFQPG